MLGVLKKVMTSPFRAKTKKFVGSLCSCPTITVREVNVNIANKDSIVSDLSNVHTCEGYLGEMRPWEDLQTKC
jgi:hypothetical protein